MYMPDLQQVTFEGGSSERHQIIYRRGDGIVWTHPGSSDQIPFAGIFEGKAGVSRFFEIVFEQIDVLEGKRQKDISANRTSNHISAAAIMCSY